jgi:hypothetical protein
MEGMNGDQIAMLRAALSGTGWLDRTAEFGRAVRVSSRRPGGLLLLGTPADEPWHLAAHLDDESRLNEIPELKPTLVRWTPPPGAPAHLAVGLDRLAETGRGEALFVVAPDQAPVPLLERVDDARRTGAVILTLDGGDRELEGLAHEALAVPDRLVSFDGAQHLVSAAAGQLPEPPGRTLRGRLARLLETISGPQSSES